ncbi:MAG TPA: hypothetical protein PK018_16330 [Candidatus Competibacter sp.]|nr:hypothetical protein [Candidatus Competibacteraceae bacterium]HPE73710.1 hypothetical protein [Candidatus Competibacter sp.]HRW64796.1 hypothetical protein [Candidatus Competibacter sp.]
MQGISRCLLFCPLPGHPSVERNFQQSGTAWVIIAAAAEKARKTLNHCRIAAEPTQNATADGQPVSAYQPTLEVMNGNDHF